MGMIPKNKISQLKSSFKSREEKKTAKGGKSANTTSMFFKALKDKETKANYHVLLFSPSYALPKKTEEFSKDAQFGMSIPFDYHNITIGKKFYGTPCKRQSALYDGLDPKEKCPICNIGYNQKRKYWDEVNALKEEYGTWENIPADVKADLQFKRAEWAKIVNTRKYDYMAGVFVRVNEDATYEIVDSVKWWKVPATLLKTINQQTSVGNYIFAEDYAKDESISYGTEFTPAQVLLVEVNSETPQSYYTCSFASNANYKLTRVDEDTIKVSSEDIKGVELKIPDLYSYMMGNMEKWEQSDSVKNFLADFNISENDTSVPSSQTEKETAVSTEDEFGDDEEDPFS